MAFPATHLLVGCGLGEVAHVTMGLPRWRAWALGGGLAAVPDVDILLPVRHGTWTHSVLAVAAITLVVWLVADWRWGTLAFAAYGSHIFLDLLDGRGPTNVYLAWPFSAERAIALTDLFPDASLALTSESLRAMAVQTLMGAVVLLLLWALARAIQAKYPAEGGEA